jgi:hypothetical protein
VSILDLIFVIFIIFLAQWTIAFFAKNESIKCKKDLQNLWLYHLLFGIIYMFYVINFGGDALGYWRKTDTTLDMYIEGGAGTAFMHVLHYPLVHSLELEFVTGSVIYAFLGFLGILFFYLTTREFVKYNEKVYGYNLFPLIFYLPNLHFWSAGVGKDTLSFLCVGLFVYSSLKIKSRYLGIALSLYLLYNVRPHMVIFLLASFGIGALIDGKLKPVYKVAMSLVFAAGALLLLDNVLEYLMLDEVSTESFEQFSNKKVSLLNTDNVGSGVDVTAYPLPLKLFTFLYRPLFFDVHNVTSLLSSIENVFLLILTLMLFKAKPISTFKQAPYQIKALIIFMIIGSIGFASTMGNLGIMVRMKNMLTPALLIFILYALSNKREVFLKKRMLRQQAFKNDQKALESLKRTAM